MTTSEDLIGLALYRLRCAADGGDPYAAALLQEYLRLTAIELRQMQGERIPANLPQLDGGKVEYYTEGEQ